MAAKPKKEPAAKGHYTGAVQDKPVQWPMAGAGGNAHSNKATKMPVVKTATVGQAG